MNRPDEAAAKGETAKRESAGAAADLGDKLVNQLFASREDLPGASHQSKPPEDLYTLLLRISHRLDYDHAERRTNDYRLVAIEGQMKAIASHAKRRSRSFIRYLVAICVGVAGTLAWQSYGDEAKQTIATTAPELGWNPEVRHMIASWTKTLARSENTPARPSASETEKAANTAPVTVPPSAPVVPVFDPDQAKQMTRSLDALRQAVEGLAAIQDQLRREMTSLQTTDTEILAKIQAPPRAPVVTPAHTPALALPPRRVPLTSAAPRP